MSWGYAAVWLMTGLFAVSAVAALVWAVQHGQMGSFSEQARSIFDEEEPSGRPTDAAPPEYGRSPSAPATGRKEADADGSGG